MTVTNHLLTGKAIRPTQTLEIGDEVLQVEGKWKSSKDVPTGLLLEFVRAGAVQTSIALEMSQRNAAALFSTYVQQRAMYQQMYRLDVVWVLGGSSQDLDTWLITMVIVFVP